MDERRDLSMSTDNTDPEMAGDAPTDALLERVKEGMRVMDAGGDDLGKVDAVRMGEAGAATIAPADRGNQDESFVSGVIDSIVDPGGDLPESLRDRLLVSGYVRIGGGLLDRGTYVAPNQIATVSGDTVRLSVNKDALLHE